MLIPTVTYAVKTSAAPVKIVKPENELCNLLQTYV